MGLLNLPGELMPFDLIIHEATLVLPEKTVNGSLAVEDGKIVAFGPDLTGSAREEYRVAGAILMPGIIDPHVHFNEPGRTEWEGIASGSRSLAAGGGTLFVEMPLNASPPTLDGASLQLKKEAARNKAVTDYAFWGGLTPGNLDQLEELAAGGVVGFKAFMSASGLAEFPAVTDEVLFAGMEKAAGWNLPVAVHAENDGVTRLLSQRAQEAGKRTLADFFASRPLVAELEAIERAILFAEATGCHLHLVHISHPRGVDLVVRARDRGIKVTAETCPHYLVLDEQQAESFGAVAKCAPPLRERAAVDRLWQMVSDNALDWIASDHSPGPPELKTGDDFFRIWGGISGCQTTLSLLLHYGIDQGRLDYPQLSRLVATQAGRRLNLPGKGEIVVGGDADLVLIHPGTGSPLRPEDLHYRHPNCPYLGSPIAGRIAKTWVRGELVFSAGQWTGRCPGRLVCPVVSPNP